jgi:hypothetical protein
MDDDDCVFMENVFSCHKDSLEGFLFTDKLALQKAIDDE